MIPDDVVAETLRVRNKILGQWLVTTPGVVAWWIIWLVVDSLVWVRWFACVMTALWALLGGLALWQHWFYRGIR